MQTGESGFERCQMQPPGSAGLPHRPVRHREISFEIAGWGMRLSRPLLGALRNLVRPPLPGKPPARSKTPCWGVARKIGGQTSKPSAAKKAVSNGGKIYVPHTRRSQKADARQWLA
jgi:hypothetical protein